LVYVFRAAKPLYVLT